MNTAKTTVNSFYFITAIALAVYFSFHIAVKHYFFYELDLHASSSIEKSIDLEEIEQKEDSNENASEHFIPISLLDKIQYLNFGKHFQNRSRIICLHQTEIPLPPPEHIS